MFKLSYLPASIAGMNDVTPYTNMELLEDI